MKKTRLVKQTPPKRDALVVATVQEWTHQDTPSVDSRRRVLQVEANEVEGAIVRLSAALQGARERLARLEAAIEGLSTVIGKR